MNTDKLLEFVQNDEDESLRNELSSLTSLVFEQDIPDKLMLKAIKLNRITIIKLLIELGV